MARTWRWMKMEDLWNYCKVKDWNEKRKVRSFLTMNTLIFAVMGLLAWTAVRLFAFNSIEWMLCFIGYPAVILGIFGGSIYLLMNC